MNKLIINSVALAISLAFTAGAMAEGMTKVDYKASKEKISGEYKAAKTACDSLSANANDVCVLEAKGKENIAKAELEATYKPTEKNRYEVQVVTAKANFKVAKERCDDKSGNAKDVCVKEAEAVETTARADAKAKMKTADANAIANEKTSDAQVDASKKSNDARMDASADKTDAQYAVAKEKCDTYSGAAKDSCVDKAKVRYSK